MDEKRIFERNPASFYSEVSCVETDRTLGNLADISLSGMMTVGEIQAEVGKTVRIRVELPRNPDGLSDVVVKARVCWCKPDLTPDLYQTGYEFMLGNADEADSVAHLYRMLCAMV